MDLMFFDFTVVGLRLPLDDEDEGLEGALPTEADEDETGSPKDLPVVTC